MTNGSREKLTVLVVGAGTMGTGIAQVAACAGDEVFLYDKNESAAEAAKLRIGASLTRAADRGYVAAETIGPALARLCPLQNLAAARGTGVVIEAVKEDLAVKRALFGVLEEIFPSGTAFWSNTSMISIAKIAEHLRYPERMAGTHFFNPVPRMKLVEIIAGARTAPETVLFADRTMRRWGKMPVRAPDTPGFIVNRILDSIKRESLILLEEGVEAETVDTAVRLGLNFPMGPFELMDLVGLNTTLDCLIAQAEGMGRKLEGVQSLRALVEQGNWGRKSGRGFYEY